MNEEPRTTGIPKNVSEFEIRKAGLEIKASQLATQIIEWGLGCARDELGDELVDQAIKDNHSISPHDDEATMTPAQRVLQEYSTKKLAQRLKEAYVSLRNGNLTTMAVAIGLFDRSLSVTHDTTEHAHGLWVSLTEVEFNDRSLTSDGDLYEVEQILRTLEVALEQITT